ncbi:MAG: hypothetical protein J6V00_06190 [Bacteroidaceae bacterium]|nr:hypothetical protein [Bacteroidaceae bacterium]
MSAISALYPELNIEWLLTGKGEMLNSTRAVSGGVVVTNNGQITGNNNMNVTHTHTHSGALHGVDDDVPMSEVEELPVVPSNVYFDPDTNIIDYLQQNEVRTSPRVKQFPMYHMWLPVCENTMAMECKPSDKLAVRILDKNNPKILNGRMYILELVGNPSILCYLTKTEGGYIASYENSRYSDDFIAFEDVEQIYKVVGLIRSFE